jgi:predicted Zn-dependent protease
MRDTDDLRNFFVEVLSLFGGADKETENTLQEWSSKLILPKYSRSQEYEADEYAVQVLFQCGYEKPELIYADTLSLIQNKLGNSGGGFFDYHPSTDERVQKISALVGRR